MRVSSSRCSRSLSRIAGIFLMFTALLSLPGCWVTSIEGLSEAGLLESDKDQTFDAGLIGTWSAKAENCAITLAITAKDQTYQWEETGVGEDCNHDKPKFYYQADLFKLDNHEFLDVTARQEDVCDICRGVHWIFLVQLGKDSFSLAPIDSDWLKNELEHKRVRIATLPDNKYTLTASAKDLKAFCRKYADDKEAFKPDLTFKRK